MIATVSIDRTGMAGSPAALVISGDGSGTYSLTNKGLGRPAITPRVTNMPDSRDVEGSEILSAVKEQTALPLEVIVQAASSAALEAAIDALDAALWQLEYDVTVTVGGVAKTWHCTPASWAPTAGVVEYAQAAQFFEVLSVTIPCKPTPEV